MEIAHALPAQYENRVKSAFEEILEEGMEKMLISFLKKNLTLTDSQLAASFDIPLAFVNKVRATMQSATQ